MLFNHRLKWFISVLWALSIICVPTKEAKSDLIFLPDIALHFSCPNARDHDLENSFMQFLIEGDFQVINEGKILRDRGSGVFDLYIMAMDNKGRSVDVVSLPLRHSTYMLTFTTKPPTVHDPVFEEKLEDFVRKTENCEITQIKRYENGGDKVANYEKYKVDRFKNLLSEVEQLNRDGSKNP